MWPSVAGIVGASFPFWLSGRIPQRNHHASIKSGWNVVYLGILCLLLVVTTLFFSCRGVRRVPGFHKFETSGNKEENPAKSLRAVSWVLIMGGFLLGLGRGLHWFGKFCEASVAATDKNEVEVRALVLEQPGQSGSGVSFLASVVGIHPDGEESHARGLLGHNVVVRIKQSSSTVSFEPGDTVSIRGTLSMPSPAMNPGEFDYRRYLFGKRVFCLFDADSAELDWGAESGSKSPGKVLVRAAGRLRRLVADSVDKSLPAEDAAFVKAVLLAGRDDLDPVLKDDLRRTGLTRFLKVSGFHVDAFAWATLWALRRITGKYNLPRLGGVLAACGMAWVSGWTPGAIRAFVSSAMRFAAPQVHRKYDAVAGLSASALAVAWVVPAPLWDVGFRMSCTGALGAWLGGRYLGSALVGMAAAMVPVMALSFSDVSLAGIVLGGLWALSVSCVAAVCLGAMLLPKGYVLLGWIPHFVSKGTRLLVSGVSAIPGSLLTLPSPSPGELCSWYALIGIGIWGMESRWAASRSGSRQWEGPARKVCLVLAAFCLLVGSWLRACPPWPEVTFLSVGQGDSAVIRYRRLCIVVDTGTEAAFKRAVLPYLKSKGVGRVDLCVLSHLHSDHAGGILPLCRELDVKTVLTMPGTEEELSCILGENAPRILSGKKGDRYVLGSFALRVDPLGTVGDDPFKSGNEACLAAFIAVGDNRVEFWADLPACLISEYLSDRGLDTGDGGVLGGANVSKGLRVIKIPHHGSADGFLPELYQADRWASSGIVAVISVGPNSYGHPSAVVTEGLKVAGADILRTDRNGAITLKIKGAGVKVKTFLPRAVSVGDEGSVKFGG